jgi:hypothetical protein
MNRPIAKGMTVWSITGQEWMVVTNTNPLTVSDTLGKEVDDHEVLMVGEQNCPRMPVGQRPTWLNGEFGYYYQKATGHWLGLEAVRVLDQSWVIFHDLAGGHIAFPAWRVEVTPAPREIL